MRELRSFFYNKKEHYPEEQEERTQVSLEACVISCAGRVRKNNEDNYYLFGSIKEDNNIPEWHLNKGWKGSLGLAAVFDGMGGGDAGEIASMLAAENVTAWPIVDVLVEGRAQLLEINQKILAKNREMNNAIGMGTTFAGIYFDTDKALAVNIGDSRSYLLRAGQMLQLSKDQSQGQRLIDAGIMNEEEARKTPSWSRIDQFLGFDPDQKAPLYPYCSDTIYLQPQDIFLICSDGISDMLSASAIEMVLKQEETAEELTERLVREALSNGGKDNITAIVIKILKIGA